MSVKRSKSCQFHEPHEVLRDEEPMTPPIFRASVSMAIWLIALCVAVLTVVSIVRGWPASDEAADVPEVGTVESGYVSIPPCGWSQITASRPGERSVSVSATCPESVGQN